MESTLEADRVAEKQDVSEVAVRLPALTKLERDPEYRLPDSGKPFAHIVLSREQAADLLKQARAPRMTESESGRC